MDNEQLDEGLPQLTEPEVAPQEPSSDADNVVNSLNAPIRKDSLAADLPYRLSVELPPTIQEVMEENDLILPENESILPENESILPENEVVEAEPRQETSSQDPEDKSSNLSCKDSGRGCFEKITLGEPEKEQLQAAGANMLRIGRQLLDEMNFMETLVAKLSSRVSDRKMSAGHSKHEALEEADHLKRDIENSVGELASHAQRLNWLQQKADEYKQVTKLDKYGSAFGSPNGSTSANLIDTMPGTQGKQSGQQKEPDCSGASAPNNDFEKRLALVETKVEGLISKVDNCEKQTMNAHTQIQGLINRIFEEISRLQNAILQNNSQTQSMCTGVNDKIQIVEQQIIQLAQTLWELQCMTRVQMHFGKDTG
ncbi:unnamed protein product [Orchesella dallaii]|uniref:Uncharacterized protein n=1 Tax=Orchesella dallaii TaxID=48710 RepID=A0ABP1S2C4_9HEXA